MLQGDSATLLSALSFYLFGVFGLDELKPEGREPAVGRSRLLTELRKSVEQDKPLALNPGALDLERVMKTFRDYFMRGGDAALEALRRFAKGYPVLILTGPRQSGKTTLAQAAFPKKPYATLEDPDTRGFAKDDPRGFLARFPEGAVLDEAQRAPELLSYLQGIADKDRRPGLFILTGSQQFGLLEKVTQTLAGRAAMVTLLPFTLFELLRSKRAPKGLDELLWRGLYPPLYDRRLDPSPWYGNYVAAYLERDVRSILGVRDLDTFQRFLRLCAGRTGQLLNLQALGSDCGVTHNTARAWLSVLQASHLVHLLPAHHRNFNKRLVKTPKLYLTDPGLACYLMGIQDPRQLSIHPQRGAVFESWVVGELLKGRLNRGLRSNAFFWRDRSGREVDILIEEGARLIAVEVKSGATVSADHFASLDAWRRLAGAATGPLALVHGGSESFEHRGCKVIPWPALGKRPPPL